MEKNLVDGHVSVACWQRLRAINDTKDIVGGKWKVMIIACLASFGKQRYLELQRLLEKIGLITRTVMNTKPITVEYELTTYGRSLKPIIDEMALWGKQHREKIIGEITGKN